MRKYRIKIKSYSGARWLWQGLQTIMVYKGQPSCKLSGDASLPDKLNAFYACLKASNTEPCMSAPAVRDDCVISLSVADVGKTFKNLPSGAVV